MRCQRSARIRVARRVEQRRRRRARRATRALLGNSGASWWDAHQTTAPRAIREKAAWSSGEASVHRFGHRGGRTTPTGAAWSGAGSAAGARHALAGGGQGSRRQRGFHPLSRTRERRCVTTLPRDECPDRDHRRRLRARRSPRRLRPRRRRRAPRRRPQPQRQARRGAGLHHQRRASTRALVGEQSIQVDGPGGPRVEFFVSSGEAEARQFQGEAQGAEQVGAALLFVNDGRTTSC